MTVGAIAAGVLGIVLPGTWSRGLLIPMVLIGSMVAGALYGAIPGWLKARFDASEIVTSLMLNFVAASMAAWVIFEVYPKVSYSAPNRSTELRSPPADRRVSVDIGILIVSLPPPSPGL